MSSIPVHRNDPSILLRSARGGPSRVFIVQTRNRSEVNQVEQLFGELEDYCSVRVLSSGVTAAFAVQSGDDPSLFEEMEAFLKEHYKFSVVYTGFNTVIHRIVEDLAMETGSRLFPIPVCRSCGEAEPFPTEVTLQSPEKKSRGKASLCERCLAAVAGDGEGASLYHLVSDKQTDSAASAPRVVRRRTLQRHSLLKRARRANQATAVEPVEEIEATRLAS